MSTKTYREFQMSKQNEQQKREEKKHTHSQTSRLENPKELQLHHNHEKFLFLTVMLLFSLHNAKCIIGDR
jgi:hypothetical protein